MVSVVLGASRGIGLALTEALKNEGHAVIATARSTNEQLTNLSVEVALGVDVREEDTLDAVIQTLGGRKIGLLIVASGIQEHDTLEIVTKEAVRRQMEVNAIGPLFAVKKLQPKLQNGAKVVLLSSKNASIANVDATGGAWYGYRLSKVAVNMAGKTLAVDLRRLNEASVAIIHPGAVYTDMLVAYRRKQGMAEEELAKNTLTPKESAKRVMRIVQGLTLENSGTYWAAETGEVMPW